MADAVTTQVIADGPASLVVKLTNVSDGTGEAAATKVTASTYGATAFSIQKITYTTIGMGFRLYFDATTDDLVWQVAQDDNGWFDFTPFGGIPDPKSAGSTGNINLTTVGHAAGDAYTIILELRKL